MSVHLNDFEYALPPRLIAQRPAARRDGSRLMLLLRGSGVSRDHNFAEVPGLLRSGDVLVLNDTKVVPAKFFCLRPTKGRIEGLFLREISPRPGGAWEVLLKNTARCRIGEHLTFQGEQETGLTLEEDLGEGRWIVHPFPGGSAEEILTRCGITPLPPYIHRPDLSAEVEDRDRYQTVYAVRSGAVAAPTAGLHFTPQILSELSNAGIRTVCVTLHVGLGTFQPVKTEDLREHKMHSEYFELGTEAAEQIATAKAEGRRIVAVGTTSVRVLESVASEREGRIESASGWTNLFLYPPAEFRIVDALLTNFHLPKSTLLMLVAAFCQPARKGGVKLILDAYAEAIRREYRFFSYGDAMLIE